MEKLSLILWRERELLELLAYKLEVEKLVLAGGQSGWLSRANREVEDVLVTLRETEVLRAMATDEAAHEVGLDTNPGLSMLAEAAEEPWRTILLDHREAFLVITRQIADLSDATKGLITTGYRSAQETLLAISGTTEGYTPDGAAVAATPTRHLIDRSL
ncbi:FlgN protein [Nocardioides terrae]|uniref:FlgN protein n=1 Tax=Nocardioides terrae TaxID=574651 RepID=A0A1I1I8H0_9ACTN|nr:flagellar export chaperone FlgN [Nocardioides terrae]SFC32351.1 FlgN protein [Nocardioides terrae]